MDAFVVPIQGLRIEEGYNSKKTNYMSNVFKLALPKVYSYCDSPDQQALPELGVGQILTAPHINNNSESNSAEKSFCLHQMRFLHEPGVTTDKIWLIILGTGGSER